MTVFQPLSKRFPKITGGVSGQGVEARFDDQIGGPGTHGSAVYRYLLRVLIVVLFASWATWNVVNSRFGRSMRALRDNHTAAAIYGADLVSARVTTFASMQAWQACAGLCKCSWCLLFLKTNSQHRNR